MALYLYAIMRAPDAARAAAADGKVEAVDHGEISALVSELPEDQLKLRRETILAHADVLQKAFEHGPVLPLRLGTAMLDADSVERELLAPAADALGRRLDALDGKGEMQVKASYQEAALLSSIVAGDPALRRAVERTRSLPAAATHFEQIRIGEAIAAAVESRRMIDGEAVLSALRPLAVAVSVAAPHHERAVVNAAFLVESDALDRFDEAVERLSEQRASEIEFKLIGPLPAYSFAEWEPATAARTPA